MHLEKFYSKQKLKIFFKFRGKTWILAKMKVVEKEKFYNIDVGQTLI